MASLFERLKADCAADWQDYTYHEFVEGLRRGDLPMAAFSWQKCAAVWRI